MSASEPINFTFPDQNEPIRTRRPAHETGAEHMVKYERAITLMKALPRSDPRSFYQQANIHCAYCTGAYRQDGNPELNVQIHFSCWDVPEGMRLPLAFANASSPLYDSLRNPGHAPPRVVDLDYDRGVEKNYTDEEQIQHNLRVMYKQMISNAPLASLFHGQPYRAGEADKPSAGTVEIYPQNTMHTWTGDLSHLNVENMGVYYSAGRDPVFYPHHANIDRLWEVWRNTATGDRSHTIFTDPDWLDSSFLFYDEEARLVRITVRDVLNIEKLRYAYDDKVGIPWLNARPPLTPNVNNKVKGGLLEYVRFPLSLNVTVTTVLRRPSILEMPIEIENLEEVLVVEGIETDGTSIAKFDVFINAREHEKVEPSGRERAGTFVCLKHLVDNSARGEGVDTSKRVALNEILEDMGAKEDDIVTVTLVLRHENIRIRGLRIVHMVE
uniref:Tyrosinase copper-binding domain-containing protein n=1 Tax=Leersia perrieri TaxID=77586 RepID=A0A0D9V6N2_9ORYZ